MRLSLKIRLILAFVLAVMPVVLLGFSMLYRNTGSVRELHSKLDQSQFLLMELHACNSKLQPLNKHSSRLIDLAACKALLEIVIAQSDFAEHVEALGLQKLSNSIELQDSTTHLKKLKQFVDYFTPLIIVRLKTQADSLVDGTSILPRILGIQVFLAALMAIVLGVMFSKKILLPLQKLLATINEVSLGNWGAQAEVATSDELGQVSNAFNQLSADLQRTAVSKEHFRLIFDTINEGLLLVNSNGKIVQSNAFFSTLSGYQQNQIVSLSVNELFVALDWNKVIAKHSTLNCELELLTSQQQVIPVSVLAASFPKSQARPSELVLTVRDERSRIAARKEREGFEKKIIHAERLGALGSLSAEVAHRLNQPLTSIRLFLQQVKRGLTGNVPNQQNTDTIGDTIGLCLQELERANKAVRSILAYTRRPESDRTQVVNLATLVKRVFTIQTDSARAVGMQLVSNLPDDLSIVGSEAELSELFFALTQNSIDAGSAQTSTSLQISANQQAGKIFITVQDNAGGIQEQLVDRIFEPFVTGKIHGKGTGLGLSIAKKIVDDHQGSISIDNYPGLGTKFVIEFPLVETSRPVSHGEGHV